MSDISKINPDGTEYNLKDATARTNIGNLAELHTTSKSDLVDAINEVTDEQANKADNDEVAPEFNDETAYSTGELVYKDGQLYKFDSDHAAGAWDASEVSPTTVAEEFKQLKNTLTHKPLRVFKRGNNLYKGNSLSLTSGIMDYDGYITITGVFPNAGHAFAILPKSVIRLLQDNIRHITIDNYFSDNSDYFARIDVELTSSSIKYNAESIGRSVGTCYLIIADYTDALS